MSPLPYEIRKETAKRNAEQEKRNAEAEAEAQAAQERLDARASAAFEEVDDGGPAVEGGPVEERGQDGGSEDPEEAKGFAGTDEFAAATGSQDREGSLFEGRTMDEDAEARQKARTGAPENKSATPDAENKGALGDVAFASAAAESAAADAGLTAEDFSRKRKSSDRGFTLADVRKIAGTEE